MFERFTEPAIKVIMLAQEEARRLGHSRAGTEQILLGLIRDKEGIAGKVLSSQGVQLASARTEVEKIIGRGTEVAPQEIPFTPNAKRLLQSAWAEAQELKNDYIGTEHLLIALSRMDTGVGLQVLKNLNVDISDLRTQTLSAIAEAESSKSKNRNRKKIKLIAAIMFYVFVVLAVVAPLISVWALGTDMNIIDISFGVAAFFLLLALISIGVFLFVPSAAATHIKRLKLPPIALFRTIVSSILSLMVLVFFYANRDLVSAHLAV